MSTEPWDWGGSYDNHVEIDGPEPTAPSWAGQFAYAASGEALVEAGAPWGYPDEMLNLAASDPGMARQLAGPAAVHLAVPLVLGGGVVGWTALSSSPTVVAGVGSVGAMAAPGYKTFEAFKNAVGGAGSGMQWHHIVEQTTANIARFGAQAIHTGGNLLRVSEPIHRQISAFYSTVQPLISGNATVREWLSTQSYQFQYAFGMSIMRAFGAIK